MFQTLVISGGSTKGLAIVGALLYLESKVDLKDITSYFCTSSGSIICSLLAIGFTPLELVAAFERLPVIVSPRLDKKNPSFFNYRHIVNYIANLFISKIGRRITFRELFDVYGKELYITTYNYTKDFMEVLSWRTHPDMDCVEGVRLSSAMPFLFEQCEYKGDVYVDGGFGNNFPLDVAYERGYAKGILGINLLSRPSRTRDDDFFKKVSELFFIPMTAYTNMVLKRYGEKCVCLINIDYSLPAYTLELSTRDVLKLLSFGYKRAIDEFCAITAEHISKSRCNPSKEE